MKKKITMPLAFLLAVLFVLGLWLIPEKVNSTEDNIFALEEKGQILLAEEKWDEAAAIYGKLTELNPYNGEYFLYHGYALVLADKCDEATAVFDKGLFLSENTGTVGFHASRCALRLEQLDRFEALLKISVKHGVDDFSRLEQEPAFEKVIREDNIRKILGLPSLTELSRDEQWIYDLETYTTLLMTIHPDPFHTTDKEMWFQKVQQLKDNIANLNNLEITGELMHLSALIGDGHTSVFPPESFALLPIQPYRFKDGFFIKSAAMDFKNLVGQKIISINGIPIVDIAENAHRFLAGDNSMTRIWFEEAFLQTFEGYYLAGAGDTLDNKTLSFTLEGKNGVQETITIPALPGNRNPLSRLVPEGWASLPENIEKPNWLKNLDQDFWFEEIPGTGIIYTQINQVTDGNSGLFVDRSEELLKMISEKNPKALVLDLRMNNGGNSNLTNRLVTGLATSSVNQAGKFFIITGRRTFSAAGLLSAFLERYTEAFFVGEPMSAKPNVYGDDNIFTLPYSGITGSISNTFNSGTGHSDDNRPWIAPDLVIELGSDDYFAGHDPVMGAILQFLKD